MEDIYKMKLHEIIKINEGELYNKIIRVPGGWIYYNQKQQAPNGVFVPFNVDRIVTSKN